MPEIWRSMRQDGDQPAVGRGANLLGVRVGPDPNADIEPDDSGYVHPSQGGMSVAPSLETLPYHRMPKRLREAYTDRFPRAAGSNNLFCWSLGEGEFTPGPVAAGLWLRLDPERPDKHGFVEPDGKMTVAEYEEALIATRELWRRWEE